MPPTETANPHEISLREKVRFPSGDTTCAAWHYPGITGACVIMAGGGAVTKEPGTDRFARQFHEAGFTVLAFDYRRLGESGGQPRQIVRMGEQHADWHAAINSPARCRKSTRRGSRSGVSRSLAATSSRSRPAIRVSPQRSRKRRSSMARPPRQVQCAIRRDARSCG